VPASITLSYGVASSLSFLLNRVLNFRSHGAVGVQVPVYAAVVTVNYLAWILGVGAGLAALGVDYRLARVLAGACEAAYMYAAMRWVVFRDARNGSPAPQRGYGTGDDQPARSGRRSAPSPMYTFKCTDFRRCPGRGRRP
jgi:hypothetical protein